MSATIYPLRPEPTPAFSEDARALYRCVASIYPIHRGITGEGLRATLQILGEKIPLSIHEVATGTPVLDWAVPQEWRIRDAWIATPDGRRVVDLADSPLHVVQYSLPIRTRMTLAELRPHLHTLPQQPGLTPYRTSYYAPSWGFCLPHSVLEGIAASGGEEQELDVCIDSELFDGSLTYGECILPGETDDVVLVSAHACHPALANDNASAIAVATALAKRLMERAHRRYTYRFVFAPGTIGAITWLAQNPACVARIRHGLVLANLGDQGDFTYKISRPGTLNPLQPIDRAVALALRQDGVQLRPFDPMGYDERQYGSPGFNLPVGRLTRTAHGEYPEYHTSADNLDLIQPEALAQSLEVLTRVVDILEGDAVYQNTQPFGEPQLGRRGLYSNLGGKATSPDGQRALLWVLNLADGDHSLLDIAEHASMPFDVIRDAADRLLEAGLLQPHDA